MSDIDRVRALLKKRQDNEKVRGTAYAEVCLDASLVEDLTQLMAEKSDLQRAAQRSSDDTRMASPSVNTDEIDAKIEAKKAEIKASTIRFDFRALDTTKYDELLEKHPNADRTQSGRFAFCDELAKQCLYEVTLLDGDPITDEAEMQEAIAGVRKDAPSGEWSPVRAIVYDLNTRTISVPF